MFRGGGARGTGHGAPQRKMKKLGDLHFVSVMRVWVQMPPRHADSADFCTAGGGISAGFRALNLDLRLSRNLWETGGLKGLTVQQTAQQTAQYTQEWPPCLPLVVSSLGNSHAHPSLLLPLSPSLPSLPSLSVTSLLLCPSPSLSLLSSQPHFPCLQINSILYETLSMAGTLEGGDVSALAH